MQDVFLGIVGVLMLVGGIVLLRLAARPKCPVCYNPTHRCECVRSSECKHEETWPMRWSQDGYVAKCKICGDIVYLGDD